MITIEFIKSDFSYIEAWTGNSESYHNTSYFEGHGKSCDLYFKAKDKDVKQEQVDIYNHFKEHFKDYIPEIERYILNTLKNSEQKQQYKIKESTLSIDVVQIPFDNLEYDLILVCGKTYKKYLFLKNNIDLRVELKNGRIKTIQRKKDTTEPNDY